MQANYIAVHRRIDLSPVASSPGALTFDSHRWVPGIVAHQAHGRFSSCGPFFVVMTSITPAPKWVAQAGRLRRRDLGQGIG